VGGFPSPLPTFPANDRSVLEHEIQAYLQCVADQLGYADAAEALGYARGSFNSIKNLYADYKVVSPLRANQYTDKVAETTQEAAEGALTPELVWVSPNRASRRQTGLERALVISDVHTPFHDERAVAVAFAMIEDLKPDTIIIGGDLVDLFSISKYVKDPMRKLMLNDELDVARGFLADLRAAAGDARIVFVQGNHEMRFEDYIFKNAPEASVLKEFRLESLLKLDELNIEYVRGKGQTKTAYFDYHGIRIGHFDSLAPKSGYLAHKLMTKYGSAIVQGHSHRLALVASTNANGDTILGAESGCLCQLDADYVDAPDWCQGLVMLTHWLDTDETHTEIVPIRNHEALYNSVIYSA
jgi:predicted phosphodiesterase